MILLAMGAYFFSPTVIRKSTLLSPEVYYELPSGGYLYIDDEYIRYNENSFNGTLDYQITLNYEFVEITK